MSIEQSYFINKIKSYFYHRGRPIPFTQPDSKRSIPGLCNGAVLFLLEKIFYDALEDYYLLEKQDDEAFFKLVEKAVRDFFREIKQIIDTTEEELGAKQSSVKTENRKKSEWIIANNKLQQAIELNDERLLLSKEEKQFFSDQYRDFYVHNRGDKRQYEDYHLFLIKRAGNTRILNCDESTQLIANHVPDLPHFERFINYIFLLHGFTTDKQYDLPFLFQPLHIKNLTLPQRENTKIGLWTIDELIEHVEELFPPRRLIWLGVPSHAIGVINTGKGYFYYDPNTKKEALSLCACKYELILHLCLSIIRVKSFLKGHYESSVKLEQEFRNQQILLQQRHDCSQQENDRDLHEWLNQTEERMTIQRDVLTKMLVQLHAIQSPDERFIQFTKAKPYFPSIVDLELFLYVHPKEKPYSYLAQDKLYSADIALTDILIRRDFFGETILAKYYAIQARDALQFWLRKIEGAKLANAEKQLIFEQKNQKGLTLFAEAVNENDFIIVSAFLRAGVDVNASLNGGNTALLLAVKGAHSKMVTFLMQLGANPNIKNNQGETPLLYLCALKKIGAIERELFDALLPKADLNDFNVGGVSAIYLCLVNYHNEFLDALLDKGFDINSTRLFANESIKGTLTFYAVKLNNFSALKLLLARSANPNIANEKNITPLLESIYSNRRKHTLELLKAGAYADTQLFARLPLGYQEKELCGYSFIFKEQTLSRQVARLFQQYYRQKNFFFNANNTSIKLAKEIATTLFSLNPENDDPEEIDTFLRKMLLNIEEKDSQANQVKEMINFVLYNLLPLQMVEMSEYISMRRWW